MERLTWNKRLCVQNKTSDGTTTYNQTQPTFGPKFPLHSLRTKTWYFIFLRFDSLYFLNNILRRVSLCVQSWSAGLSSAADNRMNSGNNLGNWLVSSAAPGAYNSITCSLTANDIVPPICGWLEQNCVHGWLVSALPRGFLPPLMTSKTSTRQNISILTSHLASC